MVLPKVFGARRHTCTVRKLHSYTDSLYLCSADTYTCSDHFFPLIHGF